MKDKSEDFHLFIIFYRIVQTQFESPIKRLLNKMELLKGKIVISLRLLELYFSKHLFLDLTGETVLTATYLINRLPSQVLEGVTPSAYDHIVDQE